jgi:hypothetical protein
MVQLPTIEIKELDLTQKVENKSQIKNVSFHFTSSSKCYCPMIRKYYLPKEFPGCAPWTDDTPECLSLPRPTNRKNKQSVVSVCQKEQTQELAFFILLGILDDCID